MGNIKSGRSHRETVSAVMSILMAAMSIPVYSGNVADSITGGRIIVEFPVTGISQNVQVDVNYKGGLQLEPLRSPLKVGSIYDMPYSLSTNCPNYRRLWLNTGVLFGGGLAALGILQVLPEDATSWNKKEITSIPLFKRWWRNVRKGPVWDGDNLIFNYVLHPYAGAAYYMGARSQGFNAVNSFIYAAGISTIFWEYGIEAFMEIPSIQDLLITPIAGCLIGEGFYLLKRHIVANGYELFGSGLLGNIVACIIDPVNEVIGLFAGNPCRTGCGTDIACRPSVSAVSGEVCMGISLSCRF